MKQVRTTVDGPFPKGDRSPGPGCPPEPCEEQVKYVQDQDFQEQLSQNLYVWALVPPKLKVTVSRKSNF
ncbi:rCG24941, partial [Rattus norvegicus]